ncbi:hypothetical protein DL768_001101 [Monosporascus sp. mg162]|nr:hypothetical protein DL768_001101 [Monosporascus sp. mg162]
MLDHLQGHSRSRQSYSEVLRSPSTSPTKTTAIKRVDAQPTQDSSCAELRGDCPPLTTNTMNDFRARSAPKPSYSVIAGNSSSSKGGDSFVSGPRMTFKAPRLSMSSTSSLPQSPINMVKASAVKVASQKQFIQMPPTKVYPVLHWPTKVPKQLSYDWDPSHLTAAAAKYAEEKELLARQNLPVTTGNGLCDALDYYLEKQAAMRRAKETEEKSKSSTRDRLSGLRAAVEAAARAGAAKYGSSRSPAKAVDSRVADFLAGKPIKSATVDRKMSGPDRTMKTGYASKPSIPFDRSYSDCSSWLTDYDQVPKDEHGRSKLPPTPERWVRPLRQSKGSTNPDYPKSAPKSDGEGDSMATAMHASKDGEKTSPSRFDFGLRGWAASSVSNGYGDSDSTDPTDLESQRSSSKSRDRAHPGYGADVDSSRQPLRFNETASWTNSKTWMSDEEKERVRFNKIKVSMHHCSLDKSPFAPRTFDEYLLHRRECSLCQQQLILGKLKWTEMSAEAMRQFVRDGGNLQYLPPKVESPKEIAFISASDGLTPVTSRPSIWTSRCLERAHIDWPTYLEYKAGGDERAKRGYDRRLPPPRFQCLAEEYEHLCFSPDPLPMSGPGVPRDKRKVAGLAMTPAYDSLTRAEAAGIFAPAIEIPLKEVNGLTAAFILDTEPEDDGDE